MVLGILGFTNIAQSVSKPAATYIFARVGDVHGSWGGLSLFNGQIQLSSVKAGWCSVPERHRRNRSELGFFHCYETNLLKRSSISE